MKRERRSLGSVIGLRWLETTLVDIRRQNEGERRGKLLTRPGHNIHPPNLTSLLPQPQRLDLAFFLSTFEEIYKNFNRTQELFPVLDLRGGFLGLKVSVESGDEGAVDVI